MKFIKKHKIAIIIITIILIILIALFLFLRIFMADNKKDEYGNRLDGIEKVEISKDTESKITKEMEDLEEVEEATYRLQGRLINISLTMKDGISIDTAKDISNRVLHYFSDDEKAYYDIQILVTSINKESSGYPKIGYKHKTKPEIVW